MIEPGHDKRTRDERFEQKSSGLTVALSGAAGSAVNSAVQTARDAKGESDDRLAALKATKAALSGVQAAQGAEVAQVNGDPNNGIGVSVSLSSQKSKSEQHMQSDTVAGSTLNAGNNLSITATGKGQGENSGDILIGGSQLKTGGDTTLAAANDIALGGAASTQQTTGKNSSSGGGVGAVTGGMGKSGSSAGGKNIVVVDSGKKGAWNKAMNKPEPNTVYKVDGDKTFQTDSLGRISSAEGVLVASKSDRNTYQQCKAGKCGSSADEGGHLITSIFNGPGEKSILFQWMAA